MPRGARGRLIRPRAPRRRLPAGLNHPVRDAERRDHKLEVAGGAGSGLSAGASLRSRVLGWGSRRLGARVPCPSLPLQALGAFRSRHGHGSKGTSCGLSAGTGRVVGVVTERAIHVCLGDRAGHLVLEAVREQVVPGEPSAGLSSAWVCDPGRPDAFRAAPADPGDIRNQVQHSSGWAVTTSSAVTVSPVTSSATWPQSVVGDSVVSSPRKLGLIMVPRFCLAGVQPAHGDQAEPEVADLGQQAVQRGLVSEQAADDRLVALAADLEAVEPGRPPAVQETRYADLILGRPVGGARRSCFLHLWTVGTDARAGHHPKVAGKWNLVVSLRHERRASA